MDTSLEKPERSPFTGAVELAEHVTPGAITQDPSEIYLRTLDSQESRRTQERCLNAIATLIYEEVRGPRGPDSPAISRKWFPWWLLRYEHTSYIRSLLVDREPPYAPATINKHLAALRSVLRQCWKMQLMTTDQYMRAVDIQIVKGDRKPAGRDIDDDEMAKLLAACARSEGPIRYRDSALLFVLESTGARRHEMAKMRVQDYNRRKRMIHIIGKGNKERPVFVHVDAVPHLDRWLKMLDTRTGPMFPPINRNGTIYRDRHMSPGAIWRIVLKRQKEAGVQRLSTHDFRRTFAGQFLESGGDLSQLQQLFGHTSATTTQRYDRREELKLRKAVDEMKIVVPAEDTETEGTDES